MGLFGVTIVILVICLCMKRRRNLKRKNSDEGLNLAYRDSECERHIWDDEDTVFEMIRKRQTIGKVHEGSRVSPVEVENIGEESNEERHAVIYI